MSNLKMFVLCSLATLSLNGLYADDIKPVKVSSKDVMFLAHFNSDVKPEIGNTTGMAYKAAITAGKKGFAFKGSSPRAECLNISTYRSFLAFPGKDNIDTEQGTLQLWLKPMWKETGYTHCVFFKFHNNPDHRNGIEWRGKNSFYIQKPPKKDQFSLTHAQRSIVRKVPFGSSWHQLAATWSTTTKQIKFYVDGELVGVKKYSSPTVPREIIFGVPDTHCAQALIDEVRIIKRVLSDQEIKQDYSAQKAGVEFATPVKKTTSNLLSFTPEIPTVSQKKKSNEENITLPVYYTVEAPRIDANLNETVWKNAMALPKMLNSKGVPAKVPTEVKLLYDSKNIYIGAIMNEPSMNTLLAQFDQRDLAIYNDDCLEFVLKIPGLKDNFYHFAVNAIGSIYDSRAGMRNYDAKGAKVKTRRLKDKWVLEMAIAFKDLKAMPAQAGSIWSARFCRERHNVTNEYSSIPATKSGSFSAPAYLGKLTFKGRLGNKSAISGSINNDSFMPGMNQFRLNLTNNSERQISAQINVSYFNNKNELINSTSQPINLKPGKQTSNVKVKVINDCVKRISVAVKNAGGETLYNAVVKSGFDSVSPSVAETAKELPYLLNNMRRYNDVKHPVYKATLEALTVTSDAITKYKQQLDNALKNNETVTKDQWDKVVSIVNGFNKFRQHRRYLIWETSPWENGSPDALAPVDYIENPELTFNQAVNEREAVCIIISGLLCRERLDLRIVPHWIDRRGKFISNSHFTVYTEPFLNHMGKKITSALIKVPGNIVTVTPGNSQRIWIVFNSRNVSPGNHKTKLLIKPLNNYSIPNREIPVCLRIFNFSLPETNDWPLDCFFWRSGLNRLDEVAMLKMVHDYHINWAMTETHNYLHGFKREGLSYNGWRKKGFDPEKTKYANQEFFDTAKKLKMKIVFAWGTPANVDWYEIIIKRLKDMGFEYKDFMFHGGLRDEFKAKDIPTCAEFRKKMHRVDSKAQFMATRLTTPPPSGASLEQIDKAGLLEFFKVWAVASGAKAEEFEYFRNHNRTVWAYRCNLNMQTRSILDYYRFFPWFGYMKNLDGVAYWTFNGAKGNDGFDHRDGYDDGITLLGMNRKPVPTKQLEAVREGLEDVAYMDILKKTLAKAQKQNPNKNYDKYKKLLKETPMKIMRDKSQSGIERWRIQVGRAIESLNQSKD